MAGEDIGGFGACNRVLEFVMAKDACVLFLSTHLLVLILYRSVCELKLQIVLQISSLSLAKGIQVQGNLFAINLFIVEA